MNIIGAGKAEGLGSPAVAVILLLGTALSVLLALDLRRAQNTEIELQTLTRAQALSRLAEAEVNRLYADLQRRAAFWSELPGPDSKSKRIQIFMEENPALLAVAYSATREHESNSQQADERLREWQAENAPFDAILGPSTLADGRRVLGANLRASYAATDAVTIFAVYDPKRLLGSLLVEAASEYAFALSVHDVELLSSETTRAPEDLMRLAREVPITPDVGEPWTITVWPTPAAVPKSYRQGPLVALTAGVFVSGLVAAALHLGTLAWRRARILVEANAALEQQIEDTRRVQAEQQHLSAELEARVAERTVALNETIAELQTFNYSVSHDLRSPLGAIINFAGIFSEDYGSKMDDVQREYLDRISASATAAVGLMDALLSYSHSGRTELRRVWLKVGRLVGEVCDEAIAARPERPFNVKIGELPDTFADETMLRFIFSNLISNACKFVKHGETASIEIGGQAEATENVYFVRDEGIGFDPRFEQKLFKAFERLHHPNEYEGHGVGLAIVARMVRRHGGRVWAQGAIDKGATFYFSIATRWGGGEDTTTA